MMGRCSALLVAVATVASVAGEKCDLPAVEMNYEKKWGDLSPSFQKGVAGCGYTEKDWNSLDLGKFKMDCVKCYDDLDKEKQEAVSLIYGGEKCAKDAFTTTWGFDCEKIMKEPKDKRDALYEDVIEKMMTSIAAESCDPGVEKEFEKKWEDLSPAFKKGAAGCGYTSKEWNSVDVKDLKMDCVKCYADLDKEQKAAVSSMYGGEKCAKTAFELTWTIDCDKVMKMPKDKRDAAYEAALEKAMGPYMSEKFLVYTVRAKAAVPWQTFGAAGLCVISLSAVALAVARRRRIEQQAPADELQSDTEMQPMFPSVAE